MGRALESGLQRRWTELSQVERIQQMVLSEKQQMCRGWRREARSLGSSYKIQGVGDEIRCSAECSAVLRRGPPQEQGPRAPRLDMNLNMSLTMTMLLLNL